MARPVKVQEKYNTDMLTIEVVDKEGGFILRNNDGKVEGTGRARVSKRHPGYLTLAMSVYTPALRVPIDWVQQFENLGESQ